MTNIGALAGLHPGTWRNYRPRLRGFSSTGSGITQPILSDERAAKGRFLVTNQGLVLASAQITFQAGDALGSGETVWGFSLPVPANRSSGGADLPIGTMFLYRASSDPALNMLGQATLMDPLQPGGAQGQEDSFIQCFLSKQIAFGTATIPSGSTTVAVTHGLAETPNAYDIKVIPTNSPTTSPQWTNVDTIGATTFNITVKQNPSTSGATFAWKIEAEPNSSSGFNLLLASAKPWAWAAGDVIGMQVEYEARR